MQFTIKIREKGDFINNETMDKLIDGSDALLQHGSSGRQRGGGIVFPDHGRL